MADLVAQSTIQLDPKITVNFGKNLGIASVPRAEFEGILGVVLHHTAGSEAGLIPWLKASRRGYHYVISQPDKEGNIRINELVPPWEATGAAGAPNGFGANHATIHIAFIGFQAGEKQIDAAKKLMLSDWFQERIRMNTKSEFSTPLYIMGHHSGEPKGVDLAAFANDVGLELLPTADHVSVQKQLYREIYERAGVTPPERTARNIK